MSFSLPPPSWSSSSSKMEDGFESLSSPALSILHALSKDLESTDLLVHARGGRSSSRGGRVFDRGRRRFVVIGRRCDVESSPPRSSGAAADEGSARAKSRSTSRRRQRQRRRRSQRGRPRGRRGQEHSNWGKRKQKEEKEKPRSHLTQKCLELASYFFPFVEKANERRCFKMSSDDVPLGDPLSASALLDVRSRASPSLLHRKGKRRTGRESYERERERKTEASKVFLGNRAHAHPSPRPPSSSLPPSLDDHNNTRPPPPAPTTTPLPLLLPRRP